MNPKPRTTPVFNTILGMIWRVSLATLAIQFWLLALFPFPLYFPPTFSIGFLSGRQSYFFGFYAAYFYTHIISAPICFLLGLIQLSNFLQTAYPVVHRLLGRVYVFAILFAVVPSGLGMAFYAKQGPVAVAGFATLSLLTGYFTIQGWLAILRRNLAGHTLWMWRSYLMICSAPMLRFMAMVQFYASVPPSIGYPFSAWASWIIPWMVFEAVRKIQSIARNHR